MEVSGVRGVSQFDRQEWGVGGGRSKGWPPAPETGSERQKDRERDSKEDGIWVSLSAWVVLSMLPLSAELHTDLILLYMLSFFQGILSSSS